MQCPLWIERSFPEEVNGDILEKELARAEDGEFHSVLFYATWCPFSQNIRPVFDALSSMFPKTSAFSRFGIRSFPSILLANRTAKTRYHGPKEFISLVHFYRETTGQDPVVYFSEDQAKEKKNVVLPWWRPAREFIKNEPYLAFSLLFIILRSFTYFISKISPQLKTIWILYARYYVNLGRVSELSEPIGRVLHVIDMKRAWSKLRLSNKKINLHKGAKSARVWASSFASVSLGESRPGYLDS